MTGYFDYAIFSFASLFAIVDPFGLIPAFLVMTQSDTTAQRVRAAAIASVLTFLILCGSAFFGLWLFGLFGITMAAFEIAGGVILLLVGLDMLQARRTAVKETREEEQEGIEKADVAVTPLAVPMLAGPGAITTVIILSSKAPGAAEKALLVLIIFLVSALTFLILRWVAWNSHRLSGIAMRIMTRLMGLLLSSIAVQFILNGLAHSGVFGR